MPNTIADNLQALNTARLNIADAITNKGGTVNTDKRFSLFPNDINTIPTANLTTLNVTENGTYYESTPEEITSTSFPITLSNSLGTNLIDYLISGNMSQTGTPTPTTPIQPQETGDRTGNLCLVSQNNTIVFSNFTNYIISNNSITSTGQALLGFKCKVEPNTSYTISIKKNTYADLRIREYNSEPVEWETNFITQSLNTNRTIATFKTSQDTTWILVVFWFSVTGHTVYDVMLNLGSTALPYEPYGIKIPISSGGKNLFDMSFYEGKSGITVSGNKAIGTCDSFFNVKLSIPPELYGQELTWSAFIKRPDNLNTARLQTVDKGSYKYGNNITGEGRSTVSFTATSTIILYVNYDNTGSDTIELSDIMLNLGSEALPYSPYNRTTTPIYLGEVPTTRRIRKYEFTGKENISDIGDYYNTNVSVLSIAWSATISTTDGFQINNGGNRIWAIKSYFSSYATVTDFKTYLQQQYAAGTPVTVWYVLATPTTGIVNEPLRKIGDHTDTLSMEQAGVQIPTNRGNTVIDAETTLKPSQMYIKYEQPGEYAGYNIVNVNVPIPTKYVTEITITENIIEDNMFKNYTALENAILPNNLTTIGIGSFENCTSLTLTTLPDTVTTINNNAFNNCTSLSLTTLPTSLITIGNNAFSGTAMTGEIHIPNTVTTIGDNIFGNTGITDIIFDGTPTTINSNAFSNINSLETIYVPWAEGTVTGAPWGAGSNVTILYVNTNWHDIREVVRKGKAQQFYPLGTVLYDDFDSTNTNRTAYEVVAYNHFNDSSLSAQGYVDSMTLCEKYVRYGVAVDDPEALMTVTTELPAGTYKFTIPNYDATYGGNKTYYFVLNNSVPVGGQLVLNWPYQAVPRTITTYASSTATTSIESYGTAASPLPEWVEGTSPEAIDLGTVTMSATATTNTYGIFNHIHRARYGSNNYAQSGIRQYMNATTTNWWTPQTIFDRRHGLNSSTGILGTLNTDFVNVLATPSITNIANNTFEYQSLNGDTFTLNTEYSINTDKLFLLSHSEVNLSATPTLGTVLDYYIDADNNKRIKYDRTNNSTARYWWFRTPIPANANYVRACSTLGALSNANASSNGGCVPACIIQ